MDEKLLTGVEILEQRLNAMGNLIVELKEKIAALETEVEILKEGGNL